MRVIKDKDVHMMKRQMAEEGMSHAAIAKEWGLDTERVKALLPSKKEAKKAVEDADTGEPKPKAKAPPKPKEADKK